MNRSYIYAAAAYAAVHLGGMFVILLVALVMLHHPASQIAAFLLKRVERQGDKYNVPTSIKKVATAIVASETVGGTSISNGIWLFGMSAHWWGIEGHLISSIATIGEVALLVYGYGPGWSMIKKFLLLRGRSLNVAAR